MPIELSDITFTEQDDIVPPSGMEPIFVPSYVTINTLAGDDIINGGNYITDISTDNFGFSNILGTLNTNSGNDLITGIYQGSSSDSIAPGIENRGNNSSDAGLATINTGDGNDTLTGISSNNDSNNDPNFFYGSGIENVIGSIDTGDGNDMKIGRAV